MSEPREPSTVRERVMSDHVALRSLIAEVAAAARAHDSGRLRSAFRVFRRAFERHLRFEERALVPILRVADAWGEQRVAHLYEEHAAQRTVIAALDAEVCSSSPRARLLDDVASLTAGLLRDMIEEESALLNEAALGEELIVIDQCGG